MGKKYLRWSADNSGITGCTSFWMSKSVMPWLRYRQNNKNSETKRCPRMLSFALTLDAHGAAVKLRLWFVRPDRLKVSETYAHRKLVDTEGNLCVWKTFRIGKPSQRGYWHCLIQLSYENRKLQQQALSSPSAPSGRAAVPGTLSPACSLTIWWE